MELEKEKDAMSEAGWLREKDARREGLADPEQVDEYQSPGERKRWNKLNRMTEEREEYIYIVQLFSDKDHTREIKKEEMSLHDEDRHKERQKRKEATKVA